ncbi:putative leucine-rich repeat receptor-like serine/threonine-protein kinase At2g24130 [Cryptomeria japonica]|uniref:putative leucine-rich repeat receptor-like serine/threonine-protein kinase At2g24130 n=1 Tax=Cryptomeria japonica TaxID=3369 RepID=UPI0027DA5546|nr:putative leucine-rich repeat receptor-like serine/threonine-protein kinase At2g24130 [Cryptomeria japonica]
MRHCGGGRWFPVGAGSGWEAQGVLKNAKATMGRTPAAAGRALAVAGRAPEDERQRGRRGPVAVADAWDLSLNNLAGVLPSSLGQLSSQLSLLKLFSNKIEGNIPSSISNLTMLSYLDLSYNLFNGTIPSSLGQFSHLERVYLQGNNLRGSIPKLLGQAKSFGRLELSENMLSGLIPNSLGDLPQLRHLYLHHNQLSGRIPSSLGRCQTLELIDLSHNKLRGNIPPEFLGLKNLQFYFNIYSNLLQGSLLEMSKMAMVQAIDVSVNNFSGEIPIALSSCTNLQYLNLSWNSFNGTIPTALANLKNLVDIDLSSNNLSGVIPMAFQEMKTLQHINLSSNRLIGEVPKGGAFATLNQSAIVGNLGLCGTWIKLSPCSKDKFSSITKKGIIPIVVGITIFIMSLLLFAISYRWRNRKIPTLNVGPPQISYKELVGATNGFNEDNRIGIGTFGSIYKGILNNGTNIAVKVLNLKDENTLQTFNRECNVLKRVRHRNVIKIISVCSNLDFKALILPFMSNGSLRRWLYPEGGDECQLILADRLRIAKEIAQGMEYLHHHCFVQVIHCDLKRDNVLLGDDMTPYISDFGITKLLFGASMNSLTSTNALMGSIGYIAPKYGVGGTISTKGYVYSYGILLLELLTRKRPTDGLFIEGTNLPKWVDMNFPNNIIEVVDTNLLRDVKESESSMILSCLTQFMQVGLACTRELQQQRPNMMEIVKRLEKIRVAFIGAQSLQLPIDILPLLESTSDLKNTSSERDENWSTSTF